MTGTSMNITPDNQSIDDLRRRIQAALNDSKRDVLREQYGMLHEHHSPDLSSEMESEWLDYVLEFERQFENAPRTTVRARIGDPPCRLSMLSLPTTWWPPPTRSLTCWRRTTSPLTFWATWSMRRSIAI